MNKSVSEMLAWFAAARRNTEGKLQPPLHTQQRDEVCKLAPQDWASALQKAREIGSPWFGCQALSHVALHAPEEVFDDIIAEALSEARKASDPYQEVGVSAWPLAAMIHRGRGADAVALLPGILEKAPEIELLSSRSEALFHLLQAVYHVGEEPRLMVFNALLVASSPLVSWRQKRNLRNALLMIWQDHQEFSQEVLDRMTDPKTKRQTIERSSSGQYILPRQYY